MTQPEALTYEGKPRDPVTAIYHNGNYVANFPYIKEWLEEMAEPGVEIIDGTDSGMPFMMTISDPANNRYFEIGNQPCYIFQMLDGSLRVLDPTIFEILFQPET